MAESEDTFQIVLLGDEVSFDCAVESEDVSEVSIIVINLTIFSQSIICSSVRQSGDNDT